MKYTGVTARGIKLPIIKKGDDLVKIVADCIIQAAEKENFVLWDRDVVAVTESLLARAQGNFVHIKDIADEVNEKFAHADCIGVLFPITSRNRFSAILKGIALSGKKLVIQLSYPGDEVGNQLVSLDDIEAKNVNPYSDVLTEEKFRELFGYPVHACTGVDYIDYYKKIGGENCTIILANNPRVILNYTKHVIPADVHSRKRTKKVLLESGAETVVGVGELMNASRNGSGFSPEYGLMGSNLSTEETLKLFPRDSKKFVDELQMELSNRTGKAIETMIFGDGAFKDPVNGIWEFYDPVVSPAYTDRIVGSPNEIKLKFLADNLTEGMNEAEARKFIEEKIRTKHASLVGKMESQGTTPRRYSDLLGSLADLISGSGDKGTPVVVIQNYFSNYAR